MKIPYNLISQQLIGIFVVVSETSKIFEQKSVTRYLLQGIVKRSPNGIIIRL